MVFKSYEIEELADRLEAIADGESTETTFRLGEHVIIVVAAGKGKVVYHIDTYGDKDYVALLDRGHDVIALISDDGELYDVRNSTMYYDEKSGSYLYSDRFQKISPEIYNNVARQQIKKLAMAEMCLKGEADDRVASMYAWDFAITGDVSESLDQFDFKLNYNDMFGVLLGEIEFSSFIQDYYDRNAQTILNAITTKDVVKCLAEEYKALPLYQLGKAVADLDAKNIKVTFWVGEREESGIIKRDSLLYTILEKTPYEAKKHPKGHTLSVWSFDNRTSGDKVIRGLLWDYDFQTNPEDRNNYSLFLEDIVKIEFRKKVIYENHFERAA